MQRASFIYVFGIFMLGILIFGLFFHVPVARRIRAITAPKSTPPPAPREVARYSRKVLEYSQDYTIVLVGDSMTEKLGNADELKDDLATYYPNKSFEVLNNGFGSTNILSVPDRLIHHTQHIRDYRPIIDSDFDLIIIESFGHNPLSELPLDQGLQKANEALDTIVAILKITNPRAKIAFAATLSPNKEYYAKGKVDLSPQQRQKWASEREAYIENHIQYAKEHNIPIIDIYHKSQDKNSDGKLAYIDTADYIHPSPNGIRFISQIMADAIYEQHLLPSKHY